MSSNSAPRHFLDLAAFDGATLRAIIAESRERKAQNGSRREYLPGARIQQSGGLDQRKRGRGLGGQSCGRNR